MSYRPAIELREISKGQLLTDILETVNVANTIGQSITLSDDIGRSNAVLARIQNYVDKVLLSSAQDAGRFALLGTTAMMKEALAQLPSRLRFVMTNTRDQTVQSAGGYRLTSLLLGQETKLYSAFNMVDLYSTMLLDIPQTIAKRKAVRFWNAALGIEPPAERDVLTLWRNGLVKSEYLVDYYRQEGLNNETAQLLVKLREFQVGMPSLRDAYYMVKKGFKKEKFFYDVAMLGQGYTKENAETLFKYFDHDPSLMELMRLNDLIPLDPAWFENKLDGIGISKLDKTVYKAAIEKRLIRDELNKIYALLLDSYQWGLISETDFRKFLSDSKFSKIEIDYRVQTGELLKLKLRVKLLRDAEIYLFRKDVKTEIELYNKLLALTVAPDIANAIVRNEAAKKGIDWELPEE